MYSLGTPYFFIASVTLIWWAVCHAASSVVGIHFFFFSHFTFQLLDKPWSQVSSLLPPGSCLQFLSPTGFSNPTAHCSSIFYRVLLTHALALFASQFVHKKKSQRIYTSMHSAGLELMKLTVYVQRRVCHTAAVYLVLF